jgi:hypothetical protein
MMEREFKDWSKADQKTFEAADGKAEYRSV